MPRAVVLVLSLLLASCGDATGILVEVRSADLAVPGDVDALRFLVSSNNGRMLDETYPIAGGWPHSLTVLPASSADSDLIITVLGLSDGMFVVRRVVTARFERGATRRVEVVLSRDCLGMMCADGVDCFNGMCVGVPGLDAGPGDGGMSDGGPNDGGVDGGPFDGGPIDGGVDGGSMDGGPMDGGPTDGGPTDGGPMDGGPMDGGPMDAGMDAFVPPIDSGPTTLRCAVTPAACAGLIVISELTTRGPGGATDEFVEIYNGAGEPADVSGVGLFYQATTVAAERGVIPAGTILPPGGFFLITSEQFIPLAESDLAGWTSSQGFSDVRGSLLLRVGSTDLDVVGWGGAATLFETAPVAVISESNLEAGHSYERKALASSTSATMASGGADEAAGNGFDSDDNSADFVDRTTRAPQNSSSTPEL